MNAKACLSEPHTPGAHKPLPLTFWRILCCVCGPARSALMVIAESLSLIVRVALFFLHIPCCGRPRFMLSIRAAEHRSTAALLPPHPSFQDPNAPPPVAPSKTRFDRKKVLLRCQKNSSPIRGAAVNESLTTCHSKII